MGTRIQQVRCCDDNVSPWGYGCCCWSDGDPGNRDVVGLGLGFCWMMKKRWMTRYD